MSNILSEYFDCVVMLTWSDWHTEARSNRYHYGTRFAKHLPVVFVQPDLVEPVYKYENTEINNLDILHVYSKYNFKQSNLLNEALNKKHFIKPLLWIYNPNFIDFIAHRYAPLKIYHATEDYFQPSFYKEITPEVLEIQNKLKNVLKMVDLVVSVTESVEEDYLTYGRYSGDSIVLHNGCDYKFWTSDDNKINTFGVSKDKSVLYQGNINNRIDWDLLNSLLRLLPDWEFWFCGKINNCIKEWDYFKSHNHNLKYFGDLTPEKVKELSQYASVGIIPYVKTPTMNISLPIKAFEYVACGLPVVTSPIKALESLNEYFQTASTAEEFAEAILKVSQSRYNKESIEKRQQIAKMYDYDNNYNALTNKIESIFKMRVIKNDSLNIIILYDDYSTHINALKEHLESYSLFSHSKIFYAYVTRESVCPIDLSSFDVIVIHYSVRLSLNWHLSPTYAEAVRKFGGYKVLYIQDEYDCTETARNWIENLGINLVFTCVPEKYIDIVYPKKRFPYVEFIQTLTGYISPSLETYKTMPLKERTIFIGYRGRELPYYYGDLGQEKINIARKMKQICIDMELPVDIEWDGDKRIYGDSWYQFISNCRATLGTESGANIFDYNGELKTNVDKIIKNNPNITYREVCDMYLSKKEGEVIMNQISPRIFEAIALRTCLVLFEGEYSGIIKPNIHYIPLKKDFSNIENVIVKLQDNEYVEKIISCAYDDIVKSGLYSYKTFVQKFDRVIAERFIKSVKGKYIVAVVASSDLTSNGNVVKYNPKIQLKQRHSFITPMPLLSNQSLLLDSIIPRPVIINLKSVRNKIINYVAVKLYRIMNFVYVKCYSLIYKQNTGISLLSNRYFAKLIKYVRKIVKL